MIFDACPGGAQDLKYHPGGAKLIYPVLGRLAATEQYGGAQQHEKYNIKHAGIKGYEKNRMRKHD